MTVMSSIEISSMIGDIDAVDGWIIFASESIEELLIGGIM